MTASRLGSLSGLAVGAVGVLYVVALAFGFARHGLSEPITDPILAIMELLTLASALPLLFLVVAILSVAPENRRVWGVLAVLFAAMFAATTSGVHVVELTAARQVGSAGLVWPSATYAIELLAWDLFLGLALLFVPSALDPKATPAWLRRLIRITAAFCLAGLIGPAAGDMRLQLIGVLGYAVLLPAASLGLARWFHTS